MPKPDGLTPAWYVITYYLHCLPNGGIFNVKAITHVAPDFLWSEYAQSYREDQLIIIDGEPPQHAFPARQVLNVELRPALANEIPKGATT